jgi:hypothetical protein
VSSSLPQTWNRVGLEASGFEGFLPLVGLDPRSVPCEHGIYVVLRARDGPHVIVSENPVVRGNVTYSVAELEGLWISETPVLYIGKAAGAAGLRDRLQPFSRKSRSHSGGRSLWQLQEADSLLVAWIKTPGEQADAVETAWINAFKRSHANRRPFANRAK